MRSRHNIPKVRQHGSQAVFVVTAHAGKFFFLAAFMVSMALVLSACSASGEGRDGEDKGALFLTSHSQLRPGTLRPFTQRDSVIEVRSADEYGGGAINLKNFTVVVRQPQVEDPRTQTIVIGPFAAGTSATIALGQELERIKAEYIAKRIPVRLLLKSGRYEFRGSDAGLTLEGLVDFEMVGEDPVNPPLFVFTNPQRPGILIQNNVRVRLAHIQIDYDYPERFGRIAYFGTKLADERLANGTLLKNRMSVPGLASHEANKIGTVFSFNRATGEYFSTSTAPGHRSYEHVPSPTAMADGIFKDNRLNIFADNEDIVVLHTRVGYNNAIRFLGPAMTDLTLEHITIYSFPQMGIGGGGFRGLKVANCKVMPRPGSSSPISGRADALHVAAMKGDIIIEKNDFSGQGDDGLNLRGGALSVLKSSSDDLDVIKFEERWDNFVAAGDVVRIMTNMHEPLFTGKVSAVSGNSLRMEWEECDRACRQALRQRMMATPHPEEPERFAIIYNMSNASSRFVVQDNYFHHNAGRGSLIQAANGIVRRNVYFSNAGAAILATAENSHNLNGPGPLNVVIADNRINRVGFTLSGHWQRNGAISIAAPQLQARRVIRDVAVVNNLIGNVGHAGIFVTRSRNIELRGNRVLQSGLAPTASGEGAFRRDVIVLDSLD